LCYHGIHYWSRNTSSRHGYI